MRLPPPRRRNPGAGFSLLELIIGLAIATEVIVAILMVFNFNYKLATVQTQLAEAQQSLRVAQTEVIRAIEHAGRGTLPPMVISPPLAGAQLVPPAQDFHRAGFRVQDNVPAGSHILAGDADSPAVLEGTDVLTVRGAIATPLFQRDYFERSSLALGGDGHLVLVLRSVTKTRLPQDLAAWRDAIDQASSEAVLFVSAIDDSAFAVLEFIPGDSSVDMGAGLATLHFAGSGSARALAYARLGSPGMSSFAPPSADLLNSNTVAILEEHRYYLRDQLLDLDPLAAPGARRAPRLSRARVYPGTDLPYAGDRANLKLDIADSIYDLQFAVSSDLNADGTIVEGTPPSNADEWLFNAAADRAVDPNWMTAATPAAIATVRLTQLATTERGEKGYLAPLLARLENHSYAAHWLNDNSLGHRGLRRRVLHTTIDPRQF